VKGGTKIRLPLCETYGQLDIKEVRAKVRDIHSSLLLFLNKLRCIVVRDMHDGSFVQRRMVHREEPLPPRKPAGNAAAACMKSRGKIVCIDETGEDKTGPILPPKKEHWLLVYKELEPSLRRNELHIPCTRVAVAIPLVSNSDTDLPQREVFAFLPLRNYGLRFVIQADFIVPSSREAVDASHAWNQWLRDEAHAVFVDACMMLVSMGHYALTSQPRVVDVKRRKKARRDDDDDDDDDDDEGQEGVDQCDDLGVKGACLFRCVYALKCSCSSMYMCVCVYVCVYVYSI
jgi:hypothetical protein